MRVLLLSLPLLLGLGCTIASDDRMLISEAAAVGHGDLNDWGNLTDPQRYEAHWKLTKALYVLDYNLNGNRTPPTFADVAPVRS